MSIDAVGIIDALDRKYGQKANTQQAQEKWVTIAEARSGAGFDGNRRQCDYLAINTWQSQGLQLIGHEIKVSMSDWRRELEDPSKAEMFARHCRRWWVVMPSELASQAKPEIPPTWGLMSVSDRGRITETVKAPSQEPMDVPVWWWIGWLAQLDRTSKRAVTAEVTKKVNEAVAKEREHLDDRVQQRVESRLSVIENLTEQAEALLDATGIDLRRVWEFQLDRLKQLWAVSSQGSVDLDAVAQRAREAADLLEELAHIGEPVEE